jgi:ribosomal small subunit protein bTHX
LASLKDFINFVGSSYNYLKIKNMGKGDKKSRRGKIIMGSHGVRRPRKKVIRTHPALLEKEVKPVVATKEKAIAKAKVTEKETKPELPKTDDVVDATVKPAKKKSSAKASDKKDEKAEE